MSQNRKDTNPWKKNCPRCHREMVVWKLFHDMSYSDLIITGVSNESLYVGPKDRSEEPVKLLEGSEKRDVHFCTRCTITVIEGESTGLPF